jgi:hypothetical protein
VETFQAVAMWPGCSRASVRGRSSNIKGKRRRGGKRERGRQGERATTTISSAVPPDRKGAQQNRPREHAQPPPSPLLAAVRRVAIVRVAKGGCSIVFGSTSPRTPPLRVPLVPRRLLYTTASPCASPRRGIWRVAPGYRVEVKVGRGRWRGLGRACELDWRLAWPQL